MQTEIHEWDGRIIKTRRNFKSVTFRSEPELASQLRKIKNKSEFIRDAVKEKLYKERMIYIK